MCIAPMDTEVTACLYVTAATRYILSFFLFQPEIVPGLRITSSDRGAVSSCTLCRSGVLRRTTTSSAAPSTTSTGPAPNTSGAVAGLPTRCTSPWGWRTPPRSVTSSPTRNSSSGARGRVSCARSLHKTAILSSWLRGARTLCAQTYECRISTASTGNTVSPCPSSSPFPPFRLAQDG